MRKHRLTPEERIAKQLGNIVSDVRLDLDLVGMYLADYSPNVVYRRLEIIVEAAEAERESNIVRHTHDPLF